MTYEFREWKQGDWVPERFNKGAYVLIFKGTQVGVTFGSAFNIMRIEVKPKGQGHGTEFIKQLIDNAREINRKLELNQKYITFEGGYRR